MIMIVEHVSENLFTIDLDQDEMKHLLALAHGDQQRLLDCLRVMFEIGYNTSKHLRQIVENSCEQKRFHHYNSS